MSESYEFDGSIEIDGVIESERVSVYFAAHCHEAAIHGVGSAGLLKKTLYLRPFDVWMLREPTRDAMKEGFYYSISGTRIGAYSYGPLGHPGDGEYDLRPIKKFDFAMPLFG